MISRMEEFLEYLKKDHCVYHVINPLAQAKQQRGPTCGYSAARFVTDFYHLCDPEKYSTLPARKNDNKPKSNDSYRHRGKEAGLTGSGGIWDTKHFQLFLDDYNVTIEAFDSKEKMSEILMSHLHLNQPVILAVNVCEYDDLNNVKKIGSINAGKNAHYISIVGYFRELTGELSYIFNSWEMFMYEREDKIFASASSLRKHPSIMEYKVSGEKWEHFHPCEEATIQERIKYGEKIKIYKRQEIDLKNIRNQCICIQPKNFDAKNHCRKEFNEYLKMNYGVNIDYERVIFRHDKNVNADNSVPVINEKASLQKVKYNQLSISSDDTTKSASKKIRNLPVNVDFLTRKSRSVRSKLEI